MDPHPRLHAVADAVGRPGTAQQLRNAFLVFPNLGPDHWAKLLVALEAAVRWVQSGTAVSPINLPASTSKTEATSASSQDEAWDFADRLFRALRCTCATTEGQPSPRSAMLRLEMLKEGSRDGARKSHILVSNRGKWHRLLIRDARYGLVLNHCQFIPHATDLAAHVAPSGAFVSETPAPRPCAILPRPVRDAYVSIWTRTRGLMNFNNNLYSDSGSKLS